MIDTVKIYNAILCNIGYNKDNKKDIDKKLMYRLYRKVEVYNCLNDGEADTNTILECIQGYKSVKDMEMIISLVINKIDKMINDIEYQIYKDNKSVKIYD